MKIHRISTFTLEDQVGKERLDLAEYSKFKYGHKPTVISFAQKMLSELFNVHSLDKISDPSSPAVITTSPYWHTPPSVHPLAVEVHTLTSELCFEKGRSAPRFVKISRSAPPHCDFGTLSVEERKLNMKNNILTVDEDAVRGRTVIFIEDARITGAHEEKTLECLKAAGVTEVIAIYVIDVKSGTSDPHIEDRMNHSIISSLEPLYELMKNPEEYVLNSRSCRFVLSWADKNELKDFAARLPDRVLNDIYDASVTDGYGLMEKYAAGFAIIRNEVKSRIKATQESPISGTIETVTIAI